MTPEHIPSGHLKFPRSERLTHRKDIRLLFETGSALNAFPVKLIYLSIENASSAPQFSVSVSKKKFKSSVDRNRIKRLIREAYRLNKSSLIDYCLERQITLKMMWIFIGNELPNITMIESSAKKLISKLCRR